MSDIPKRITEDQYDKLVHKLWKFEQRLIGVERATMDAVAMDKLFDEQRMIKKMLIKIGTVIFKKGIK